MPGNTMVWSSQDFIDTRLKFQIAPSEELGFEILRNLTRTPELDIDEASWLECKALLSLVLDYITFKGLVQKQQPLLLECLENSPVQVVYFLTEYIIDKEKYVDILDDNILIGVAFSNRIVDSSFEIISKLLAPVCYKKEIVDNLLILLQKVKSHEQKFRIYQILLTSVRINNYNDRLSSIFECLLEEIQSSDVLVQLAGLEMLSDIAVANQKGISLIVNSAACHKIYLLLQSSRESPDGGFIFSYCLKFFGCMSRCYAETIQSFPEFPPLVFNSILNYDVLDASQRVLIVETFAQIAFSAEGKELLDNIYGKELITTLLQSITSALKSGPFELRTRIIDAITTILENGTTDQLSNWINRMPDLIIAVSKFVRTPFTELKSSALEAMIAISTKVSPKHLFTIRDDIEEFKDWICDSNEDADWEILKLKSHLINTILENDVSFLDASFQERLKRYFSQPNYNPRVATLEF